MILNTIADLQALSSIPSDNHVHVMGYNVPADGGGGDFYWDATATEDENYGTIFECGATIPPVSPSTQSTGKWIRYYTESVNVKWFGATGDGTTNDAPAFQKMIDWCEPMGIKDVVIPFGDFYLEESVYVRIGGIKFIGQGSLLREDSPGQSYVDGSDYNGAVLKIKKNISGIVYDTTVKDSVYWRGVSFRSEYGRTAGTSYAIDFMSTYDGPTWPFNVHECHFAGFNRVFNFTGEGTTYNIASIDITHCAFVDNDEIIYQGYQANTNERYTCWGLNFQHNKCHWNSRVIYGSFGKDLVTISHNNFEGNRLYSDNITPPPYSVDLEIYNCAVIFHGNHFEGAETNAMVSDCVSISSIAKNQDGSYKPFDVGAASYVDIYGNNFDGINPIFKPYTLTGCIVRVNESGAYAAMARVHIHECEILENSRASFYLTDYAKEHGTIIKFANQEQLSSGFINTVNSYGTGLDNNAKGFLIDGKQWARTTRSGFGLASKHSFKGDVEYCIATFKIRNNAANSPGYAAYCQFTKDGITNPDHYVYGTLYPPVGESIAVCIFPSSGIFTSTSNNIFSVGLGSSSNSTAGDTTDAEYSSSVFMYTTTDSDPVIIPVFEPNNVVDDNNGTFIEGQTFFNGTEYKIVTESGTMVTPDWSPGLYVVTNISGNKIELNGTYDYFTQGQFIDIGTTTYRIIELDGLWATLDKTPAFTIGAEVYFHRPTFSSIITTETDPVYTGDNDILFKLKGTFGSGENANDYINSGWYVNGAGSPTGSNFPINKAGFLQVTPYYYDGFNAVMQDYSSSGFLDGSQNRKFFRTSWAGTYNDWREYAFQDWVTANYIQNQDASPQPANMYINGTIKSITSSDTVQPLYLGTSSNGYNNGGEIKYLGAGGDSISAIKGGYGNAIWNGNDAGYVDFKTYVSGSLATGMKLSGNNLDVGGFISQGSVTSAMLKTNSSGDLVAAVAGTDYVAPGTFTSGTYTPTVTAISGVGDTYSPAIFTYTRIGNIVHVAGTIEVTTGPSNFMPFFAMHVSLPIASTISSQFELTGVGNGIITSSASMIPVCLTGNTSGNNATVLYQAANDSTIFIQFDYIVQ